MKVPKRCRLQDKLIRRCILGLVAPENLKKPVNFFKKQETY